MYKVLGEIKKKCCRCNHNYHLVYLKWNGLVALKCANLDCNRFLKRNYNLKSIQNQIIKSEGNIK